MNIVIICTILFSIVFIISFCIEKLRFRNAVFLLLALFFGLLSLDVIYPQNGWVEIAVMGIVFILCPLCVLTTSVIFILAGILTLRREGVNLKNALSIFVGLSVWVFGGLIVYVLFVNYVNRIVNSLTFALAMLMGYFIFTFAAFFIYSVLYSFIPKRVNRDFIIIHGAGLLNGSEVSPLLAKRIDKGIEVYKKNHNQKVQSNKRIRYAKIIVSGGKGSDEDISEAQAMKNYLLNRCIPEDDIIVEDKSTTTYENLKFSKDIMEGIIPNYSCVFVTNNYHVFRTGLYAKRLHIKKAEGVGCKTALYYWCGAFIREYVAIMVKFYIINILYVLMVGGMLLVSLT